jgi:hypothetical protein
MSALDAHVGKKIFEKVIINYLKNNGKTIIFATHAINYLKYFDNGNFPKFNISNCFKELASCGIRNLPITFLQSLIIIFLNASYLEKGRAK